MKIISIITILLLLNCAHYSPQIGRKVSIPNNQDDYFIGLGSARNYGDVYETRKKARLRALTDITTQIKVEITSQNNMNNLKYDEHINAVSKVILKKWQEETWEKDGYFWSKIRVKKSDYYEEIQNYIDELSNKILYLLEMSENGQIIQRLKFLQQAMPLAEKLGKLQKTNKILRQVKRKTQKVIDSISVVTERTCEYRNTQCIKTNIKLNGLEDNSISVNWTLSDDKFIGSINIGKLKNQLMSYGIVFPTFIIDVERHQIEPQKHSSESYIMPKIKVDTIYEPPQNNVITNLAQITDTTMLRRSNFFIRRKIKHNVYALFDGVRQSSTKLSAFLLPDNKKPLHFIKTKFYSKNGDDPNNDISEIYFDQNFIYAENIVTLYYVDEKNNWQSIRMMESPLANLTVLSQPSNAQVFINGKYVGQTPYYLGKPTTSYAIICVKKQGYYLSEYFTSLSEGSAVTKKFILRPMPEIRYGTFLNPDYYYGEDKGSWENLLSMIEMVDKQISILNENKSYNLAERLKKLYILKRRLEQYKHSLENRLYSQYHHVEIKIPESLVLNTQLKNGLILKGKFLIPNGKAREVVLNKEQCYFRLAYKRQGKQYKILALYLLYRTDEYLFEGVCGFEK